MAISHNEIIMIPTKNVLAMTMNPKLVKPKRSNVNLSTTITTIIKKLITVINDPSFPTNFNGQTENDVILVMAKSVSLLYE